MFDRLQVIEIVRNICFSEQILLVYFIRIKPRWCVPCVPYIIKWIVVSFLWEEHNRNNRVN